MYRVSNFKHQISQIKINNYVWEILGLFVIWRVLLVFVEWFGAGRITVVYNFYGLGKIIDLFKAWANWDGGHYLGIAQRGYEYNFQYAFFPLYPLVVKLFSIITFGDAFLAGHLVSTASTILCLIFLYRLVRLKYNEDIAFRSLIYLLLFPSAFFLVSAYTESTYLFFSISAFYFSFKKNWKLACFFGMLTAVTRPFGIFLVFALGIEYFQQINFQYKKIEKNILWFFITPLGLLSYMIFLFNKFGDPLYFIKVQIHWQRSDVFLNPIKILSWQTSILLRNYETNFLQFIGQINDYFLTILFLIFTPFIFLKISKSMAIYMLILILLPISSGQLVGQSRYLLVLFPFFILLAKWGENRLVNFAVVTFGAMFLSIFTVLFINGYWLA